MGTTRQCTKCHQDKELTEFTPRPNRPIGTYSVCKSCKSEFRSRRYRERRESDPIPQWIVYARNWAADRARRQGIPCTITQETVRAALGHACVYCGILFNFQRNIQTRKDSPTIDRIIPALGYVPSNIVVCCYRCNQIKNEATPEELRHLADVTLELVQQRHLRELLG